MQARGFFRMVGKTALKTLLGARVRQLLMCFERFRKAVEIDLQPALLREFLRQLNGEAVGIV
ncbi:hypothetical protein SDC9_95364 [bioreactor metagenome]|uniref:Uncharacterized protein n=1 Tax=bioreactor metagenome TaxID=1076179 RepID=A0A645A7G7_9ZZZZ